MANGYVRQSSGAIVALAKLTSAAHNNEYNALQTAFDSAAGHNHNPAVTGAGSQIDLTVAVTGILPIANGGLGATLILPIANGGTGSATAAAARTALGISTIGNTGAITDATGTLLPTHGGTGAATLAAHGVVVGNGTGAVNVTGAGTAGQVLTSNGAAADPTYQATQVSYGSATAFTQSQMVTNGTNLTTTAGWTGNNATLTTSANSLVVTTTSANGSAYQALTTVAGDSYVVQLDVTVLASGTAQYGAGTIAGTNDLTSGSRGTTGTGISFTFTATGTTTYLNVGQANNAASASYNNIVCYNTVRKLTAASNRVQYITTAGPTTVFAFTLVLPDATTFTQTGGPIFIVKSTSASTLQMRIDNNSRAIQANLIPGGQAEIDLEDLSTAAGIWVKRSTVFDEEPWLDGVNAWLAGSQIGGGMHYSIIDPTHLLVAYIEPATSDCKAAVLTLDATTGAPTLGTPVQISAGANTPRTPFVIQLSATQMVVAYWDSTAALVSVRAVNISGTTVTCPTTTLGLTNQSQSTNSNGNPGVATSATAFYIYTAGTSGAQTLTQVACTIVTATGVITQGSSTALGTAATGSARSTPWLLSGTLTIIPYTETQYKLILNDGTLVTVQSPSSSVLNSDLALMSTSTAVHMEYGNWSGSSQYTLGITGLIGLSTGGASIQRCFFNMNIGVGDTAMRICKVAPGRFAVLTIYKVMFFSFSEKTGRIEYLYSVGQTANTTFIGNYFMQALANNKIYVIGAGLGIPNVNNAAQQIQVTV